jgi:F-type H+-transporting ATPase subunit b|tara:strand:- start:2072 stop:2572 length:501 start_codon:yes stop_codon:yes gene_type:complete
MDSMQLVTPAIGLMFWTVVIFVLLLILLKKFAWKPILKAVDDRNSSINEALASAEKAKSEMEQLSADNDKILNEARIQRDSIIKEAREIKNKTISDAKNKASIEAEKIISSAKEQIRNEKMKAMTQLKNEIADISIQMAEKIIKSELKDPESQKKLIEEDLKKQMN